MRNLRNGSKLITTILKQDKTKPNTVRSSQDIQGSTIAQSVSLQDFLMNITGRSDLHYGPYAYRFLKGELLLQKLRLSQTVPSIDLFPLYSVAYHLENKLVIIIIIIKLL